MPKSKKIHDSVGFDLLRICRVHFVYVLLYMASIIIFDSWNLISHEAVLQRWTLAGSLLVVNVIIWYLAKLKLRNQNIYKVLLAVLILCDIAFASVNVYWQRGMASKAVLLYIFPVVAAALVRSRSLLLATAGVSAASYSVATVRYFYDNYGQGYKVELYGEIFFYGLMFFVIAGLLMVAFRPAPE